MPPRPRKQHRRRGVVTACADNISDAAQETRNRQTPGAWSNSAPSDGNDAQMLQLHQPRVATSNNYPNRLAGTDDRLTLTHMGEPRRPSKRARRCRHLPPMKVRADGITVVTIVGPLAALHTAAAAVGAFSATSAPEVVATGATRRQ